MKNEIRYLYTILDLCAPVDLTSLAEAITHSGKLVTDYNQLMQDGTWCVRFMPAIWYPEPDQIINVMLTLIEVLDEPSQRLWNTCTSRRFDIGYKSGDQSMWFYQQLEVATLARIVAAKIKVGMTIQPLFDTDYLEAAIEILKNDESIQRYLGNDMGWSISNESGDPFKVTGAEVKVTMTDLAHKRMVYVHCRMELTDQGQWVLKEIIKKEEQ